MPNDMNRHFSKENTQMINRQVKRCSMSLIIRKCKLIGAELCGAGTKPELEVEQRKLEMRPWSRANCGLHAQDASSTHRP